MHAHELAALDEELEDAELDGFGLLNVENLSCLRALPHFGHAIRSPFERTRCSKVVSHSWQTYS